MDTVLGLSMTPTTVGLVLVEGRNADGATMGHDAFEARGRHGSTSMSTSEYVAEALSRTRAITDGQRLQSIGVTWSDDAYFEATQLLESLSDSGFDNVVPIELSEATEALARGIGNIVGSQRTAACVVESGEVIALLTDPDDGSVQTAVSNQIHSDDDLVRWLTVILERDDWQPDGLVVMGSCGDLDAVSRELETTLSLPVFAPPEAGLALARGAALASADGEFVAVPEILADGSYATDTSRRKSFLVSQLGAVSLLVAGAVTFVASASLAVSLHLIPTRDAAAVEQRPVANTALTPAVKRVVVPQAPPPIAEIPAPAAPPPPLAEAPIEQATVPVVADVPESDPPLDLPADPPAAATMVPPPEAATIVPPPAAVPPPAVPPVPYEKPSLKTRILQRLGDLRNGG